jgi:hypothetical protein
LSGKNEIHTRDREYITDKPIEIWKLGAPSQPPLERLALLKVFSGELETLIEFINQYPILHLIPRSEIDFLR